MRHRSHPEPRPHILIIVPPVHHWATLSCRLVWTPALHKRFPQAELLLADRSRLRPLLKHNPKLKDVLIWPRAQWEQLPEPNNAGALWRVIRAFIRCRAQLELRSGAQAAVGLHQSGLCV